MNKDSVYVLKQPTHSIVSLVVVEGDELPLDDVVHSKLDSLNKISDLVFIFSNRFENNLDVDKFSNLYHASAYIYGSSKVISSPLVYSMKYCFNIFQKHVVYLFTSINKLSQEFKLGDTELHNIQELSLAPIKKPILVKERLSSLELSEIYMLPKNDKNYWWHGSRLNTDRLFSTMKSPTPIMFFKKGVIENILTLFPEDSRFVDSFIESDISYFIASLLDKLDIDVISGDILKLKVGDLKNEQNIQAKGV